MPLLLAASLAAAAVEGHFPGAAGGGYPEPWTRDAAINSWNARLTLRLHGEGNPCPVDPHGWQATSGWSGRRGPDRKPHTRYRAALNVSGRRSDSGFSEKKQFSFLLGNLPFCGGLCYDLCNHGLSAKHQLYGPCPLCDWLDLIPRSLPRCAAWRILYSAILTPSTFPITYL